MSTTKTTKSKKKSAKPKKRHPTAKQLARRRVERRRRLRRALVLLTVVGVTATAAVLIPLRLAQESAPFCVAEPASFPSVAIEGWHGEQLQNAATIMSTASALGFQREGQILGVMTAMGESSLRNIDYGDWETRGFTNPDGTRTTSIGLFQQQEWWGSVDERMDPATAATLFYRKLALIDGWQQLEPSHAIHRVQVNTDADYYTRYLPAATAVVDRLNGGC